MNIRYLFLTLFLSVFITACGSSSSSSDDPTDNPTDEPPGNGDDTDDDDDGEDTDVGDTDDNDEVTASALVAHYRFENDLNDETGNFNGQITGNAPGTEGGAVTYQAGAVEDSTAVALDGTSGIALGEGLIGPGDYSISIWLHPDELKQHSPAFFGQSGPDSWVSLVPAGPGDNEHTMLWAGSDLGTGWFDGTLGTQIPSGDWSHLVFTYSEGELNTYLNGELAVAHEDFPEDFPEYFPNVFSADNAAFHLGVNPFELDTPYTGLIDELRIYNVALTQEHVTALAAGEDVQVDEQDDSTDEDTNGDDTTDDGESNDDDTTGDDDSTDDGDTNGDDSSGDDDTTDDDDTSGDDATGDDTTVDESTDEDNAIDAISGLSAHYPFSNDLSDSTGTFTTDGVVTATRPWEFEGGSVTYDSNGIGGGQALALDGTSGVRLPDGLISGSAFTVSLWVNPSELTDWKAVFFGERVEGRFFALIPKAPSGEVVARGHFNGNDPAWWDVASDMPSTSLSTNEWAHLAVSLNGSQLRLYINGELVGSADNFDPIFEGSENGVFALGVTRYDEPFLGLLDQLRIYDRALEADEVMTLSTEND